MAQEVVIAYGDGIGPEIMESVLRVMQAAKTNIKFSDIKIGKEIYEKGWLTGIPDSAWDIIKRAKILLKSPITTPQGKGYRSLNVTFRKNLGLYANIRPCVSYHPFVKSITGKMFDLVVVRENEEDLYSGIEYRLTQETTQCIKITTRSNSANICKYAFDYAENNNRKKVTCFAKDNIMKMTDGLFCNMFDEIAKEYTEIQNDKYIIDIGAARLAKNPELFDVIVTSNLYGDILSDIAAEISGSIGIAGSANIGNEYAMFEAVHGSAPDIAGNDLANPSGLLMSAIQMLTHIGQYEKAILIKNALLKTIEDGIHTADIFDQSYSKEKVKLSEFTKTIIGNLGDAPKEIKVPECGKLHKHELNMQYNKEVKKIIGVDFYIEHNNKDISDIVTALQSKHDIFSLCSILSKGLKIWPEDPINVNYSDQIICRIANVKVGEELSSEYFTKIVQSIEIDLKLSVNSIIKLYSFDNKPGFSMNQEKS